MKITLAIIALLTISAVSTTFLETQVRNNYKLVSPTMLMEV
jgi:hypothetical protein